MKTYIGFSRDHSGSMRSIAHVAMKDYNSKIETIKESTLANKLDTIVSVVENGHGHGRGIKRVVTNSNIVTIEPMTRYIADGSGTPLLDSVGDLIEQFEALPDASNPDVSFLVMAITDGHENASVRWNWRNLGVKIAELNKTDRWTFVFRVPRGHTRYVTQLGIPVGNIQEWDQTERGTIVAAQADAEAFTQYFTGRSVGTTSTQKFYTSLADVKVEDVARTCQDITNDVALIKTGDKVTEIRPFIIEKLGNYKTGAAFYQLTKTETIQEYKKLIIRDKTSRKIFSGNGARQMIGLPNSGALKVVPGDHGNFDIFVQSTSVNRKLMPETEVIYWNAA